MVTYNKDNINHQKGDKNNKERFTMELLKIENGQATVSSRQVAEHFGKRNVEVMDNIRVIEAEISSVEFSTLFTKSQYKASNGKYNPEYIMNRDGFCLVAMGFTGKKALQWKLKYIEAFNNMEKQIRMQEQTEVNNISIPQVVPMLCKEFMDLEKRISALEKQGKPKKEVECIVAHDIIGMIRDISKATGIWLPKIYEQAYRELEMCYHYNLTEMLENKRREMRKRNICKTTIKQFKKIDLLQQDEELFLCFSKVIKEMAKKVG